MDERTASTRSRHGQAAAEQLVVRYHAIFDQRVSRAGRPGTIAGPGSADKRRAWRILCPQFYSGGVGCASLRLCVGGDGTRGDIGHEAAAAAVRRIVRPAQRRIHLVELPDQSPTRDCESGPVARVLRIPSWADL